MRKPSTADAILFRMLDITLTCAILVLALPIIAIISLIILLRDGAPVLFQQKRVGKNAKEFDIYKFRTMVPGSDAKLIEGETSGETLKEARAKFLTATEGDPRITPTGKFLRETHMDELPQFFNVLKGDLSLVGVRPDTRPQEVDYPKGYWAIRHRYTPGITGPDQLIRSQDIEGRMENEKIWVNGRNIGLYIKFLFLTGAKVFKRSSF